MSKERADQENPPSTVESVAGPEGGDGGSLGECEDGSAAAAMPGQPAVVPLSPEDLGRVADVVLGPVDGADRRPEPDRMGGAEIDVGGPPDDGEPESAASARAAPADRTADMGGPAESKPGCVSGSARLMACGGLPVAAAKASRLT